MDFQLVNRFKLSDKAILLLIGALFLIMNISGDHVFNKVNNLKMVLVISCIVPLSFIVIRSARYLDLRVLMLLIAPILATFLGAVLSNFKFSYGLPYELSSQLLCVIWSFLLYSVLLTKKQEKSWKALWFFIPTIYFVCVIAFLEKLGFAPLINIPLNPFEASSLSLPWEYRGIAGRVESTFGNINYFANFLIQVFPITLALFLITKLQINNKVKDVRFQKTIVAISAVFVLIALILTQTRSAILAAALSIIVFTLLLVRVGVISKARVTQVGIITFFSLMVLALIMMGLESDRFSALLDKETWWPRTIPWQVAWGSFMSAPFFGHGVGASYQLFFEFITPDSRLFSGNRSYNHVHNEVLQILQEGGVFGLAVYLTFWAIPFWLGIQYVIDDKQPTERRILVSALVSGLIAYHFHGLFSVAPRMISSRIVAYSLLAILLAVLFRQQIECPRLKYEKTKKIIISTGLFIIIIAMIGYLIPFAQGQYRYAHALASPDRSLTLIDLAHEYDDIYILEAAAKEAFEQNDAEKLLDITNKAATVFPHYRQMDIYYAYALFWQGKTDAAYLAATQYQAKDAYSVLANSLLLGIALEQSSEKNVLNQLKTSIEFQACKNRLLSCEYLAINVVSGHFNLPFQIVDKGKKWNVLVDKSFFRKLKDLKQRATVDHAGNVESEEYLRVILKLLSQGQFFKPKSNNSVPLGKSDYDNLTSYLNLINQNRQSNEQAQLIAEMLEKRMQLEVFLQSRDLLIGLSNTILNAIK